MPGQAEILALPRPRSEVSQQYRRLIAAIAPRTISEILAATATHADTVRAVTINARARGIESRWKPFLPTQQPGKKQPTRSEE
ncbi:MAG: hypothetical protein ABSB59_29780 [Streptosporangiaceae bacterium]